MVCDDCSSPLSACWSKGRDRYHPYYLCQKRSCVAYGKSIRRDKIEGDFAALLRSIEPTDALFKTAR
ncbi:recombinase zinc beta ribbon domain-containing protein, partial [Phenylobacterium sp.]|uniref:recombinase zinc beta ribbon domain-containing protein n=1 Tax=Phenylobacterium sp. TaxID=1871053 RepID=UPI0039C93E77